MSAEIQLGWNNGKLQAGAAGAAAIVNKASAQMKSALNSIGSSIANGVGIGAGVGIFNSIASAIKALPTGIAGATVAFDSMRIGMGVVEGSAEGAAKRIEELQELAKLPGLGFQQAVEGDIRLRSAGVSASVSKKAIEEMGNALAVVGKGKADMDGVILALSQIASKGKVSAEEINQIAERVPQIRAILKSTFGTADTEEIQKMGIPVESFITLVVDGFSRTVPRAIVGLQGKMDNFSDALQSSLATFGVGIAEELVGPLDDATDAMGRLNEKASDAGSMVGLFIGAWKDQFTAADTEAGGLLQSFADLFASDYWQQHEKLVAKTKELAEGIADQKKKTDQATESVMRAATQDKEWAKQRENLNVALDLYIAKQDAANAKTEAAAAATAKQNEELAKLQTQLDSAQEKSSNASLNPKMQQQQQIGKLGKLDAEIDYAALFGDEQRVLQLKIEREGVLTQIGELEKKIKSETQKQIDEEERLVELTARRAENQRRALDVLDKEISIIEATGRGHDKKAAQLQRELDIQEATSRIVEQTGLAYDDAARVAERLVTAKEKADNRGKDGNGGRSKIYGYSQEQGGIGDARERATGRVDDSRKAYAESIGEFMGMGGLSASKLTPRSTDIGARTPATDAVKPTGESELAILFKAYSEKTVEIFEKALA